MYRSTSGPYAHREIWCDYAGGGLCAKGMWSTQEVNCIKKRTKDEQRRGVYHNGPHERKRVAFFD